MDNRHDKRVEEQRIGEAADAVEKQDQRIVGVTEAENEEQHVEYAPQHEANHHRFQRVIISATTPEIHADSAAAVP